MDGTLLDPEAVANPCGLIAKTYFNDFYNLQMLNSGANEEKNYTTIDINQKDIAWEVDRKNNYKRA